MGWDGGGLEDRGGGGGGLCTSTPLLPQLAEQVPHAAACHTPPLSSQPRTQAKTATGFGCTRQSVRLVLPFDGIE